MSSYKNLIVFNILLNKIFRLNKNISFENKFVIESISQELDDDGKNKYVSYNDVEINSIDDIYDCYQGVIDDLEKLFVRLEKADVIRYESIISLVKDLQINLDKILEKCDLVTQTKYKQIDFDKLNVVTVKNSILRLVFKMSYGFDKLLDALENDKIKVYYNGSNSFNWAVYVLNQLCNNAFRDVVTDRDGRISLETVKYICYSLFQTDEVTTMSNKNIMCRMFMG
ncbi:MAG: hypothetical protein Harvfovirus4_49 [Harvfovirus sp.]|uniref:Uncharacterized protein n=1 Tax=Harvfovirus sp. TaxID=2487768 RepID=A0A3G5A0H3_9VIRU|nr:MAG: hypothetical protein Harvfovirus4_49 [Harvfovirus sp.]